ELAKVQGEKGVVVFADVEHVIMKSDRSLVECFKMFDLIHVLTTDHETVSRITKEVIEDFASENIVYVELRTTPKRNEAKGMTKRSYMEAVIDGLRSVDTVDVSFIPSDFNREKSSKAFSNNDNGSTRRCIFVRLLLSIDRRESTAAAMDTVQLALELRTLGVVGIDLSGNPLVGNWDTFLQPLLFAKDEGLPVTLHCGEVRNRKEEVQAMLDFLPQRIGHAIFFEEQQWKQLKQSRIPVEICLTSNILTECVISINNHHFDDLYKSKHPIALCTDDTGVFSTSLSHEYRLAASAFGLSEMDLYELGKNSIEYVFADEAVKKCLREVFYAAKPKLMLQHCQERKLYQVKAQCSKSIQPTMVANRTARQQQQEEMENMHNQLQELNAQTEQLQLEKWRTTISRMVTRRPPSTTSTTARYYQHDHCRVPPNQESIP
ncbi:adenosine deaminase-like protein, partial [Thalictrum thalictroides]